MSQKVAENFKGPHIDTILSSSKNEVEQIPVFSLTVSSDVSLEIDPDSFIEGITVKEGETDKTVHLSEYAGKKTGRDILLVVNGKDKSAYVYVSPVGKKIESNEDIEHKAWFSLPVVLTAVIKYQNEVNKWLKYKEAEKMAQK